MMACSKCTPPLKDVTDALKDVTLWEELAVQLGFRASQILLIQKHPIDVQKLQMIIEWLKVDTEASWEKLVDALAKINEKVLAAQIRVKYIQAAECQERTGSDEKALISEMASERGMVTNN